MNNYNSYYSHRHLQSSMNESCRFYKYVIITTLHTRQLTNYSKNTLDTFKTFKK